MERDVKKIADWYLGLRLDQAAALSLTLVVVGFLLLVIAFAAPARGAAFNCDLATKPTEILICQDEVLSFADDRNAEIFYRLRGQLTPEQARIFNAREREWLKARNYCGYNRDCVLNAYALHFSYLCGEAENFGFGFMECEEDGPEHNPQEQE
jgi:hypothetical protein